MTTVERLTKLENDLTTAKRRNRWTLAAAFLLLAGMATTASIQNPADEVRARRFVVVDAQGQVRAELGVDGDGSTALVMQDAKGNKRVLLYVDSNAQLYVDSDGTGLLMTDSQGELRAQLYVDADGPTLSMLDAEGKVRSRLAATSTGPELEMADAQGETRAILGVLANGGPALSIGDEQGKPRVILNLAADGSPRLDMYDAQVEPRVILGLDTDGPMLGMFDAQGLPVWGAP